MTTRNIFDPPAFTTSSPFKVTRGQLNWLTLQMRTSARRALLEKFIELNGEEPEGMEIGVLLDLQIEGDVELIDDKWVVTEKGRRFLRGK